ncbi:MAG: exodeoxyribonuclease VII small subunit [Oscillospiraceae bacterium]|jgi:exodeoxyribonuclease VII small subunit|nr:exodeoxyribonuclease VII small subunit [Oscillospiraceae bacterium]
MNRNSQSFEKSMNRLEEIVRSMERGDLPLEKALSMFEEGTALIASCHKLLDEAELKVLKLSKGSDGNPVEKEFVYDGE